MRKRFGDLAVGDVIYWRNNTDNCAVVTTVSHHDGATAVRILWYKKDESVAETLLQWGEDDRVELA